MFFAKLFKGSAQGEQAAGHDAGSRVQEKLEAIGAELRRIESRQQEVSIQLEDMDEYLRGGQEEAAEAAMALADIVFDFHRFCAQGSDARLLEQSEMMRAAAAKAASSMGLEVVDAQLGVMFDTNLHTAQGTGSEQGKPDGLVLQTLASGYVYNGRILRRVSVVINKAEVRP